jgi:hypothetical protein
MKATVGRIVHIHSSTIAARNAGSGCNGQKAGPYPAIVTQVFTDGEGNVTYCNLKAFLPFADAEDFGSVPEKGSTFDTSNDDNCHHWVWPPRD